MSYYHNRTTHQPDELDRILALRPENADTAAAAVENLENRMKGAFIGRCAGCTLGVPVEMYPVMRMQAVAMESDTPFPPTTYWKGTDFPDCIHYGVNKRTDYLEQNLCQVPVDDDITYVILNLLLLEKYGKNYSVDDVGQLWLDVLPYACTAEDEALRQLKAGTKAAYAANSNEYIEWIGAAIRADAFGYAAAGDPVTAAKLSYNDAYLTHRQNGIYGEMFCAASIAAAFTAKTPLDAVKEGMKQIPKESELYKALEWAMEQNPANYLRARMLLDEKFRNMSHVHTINNMCAIVFALKLGGNDFTGCISECVAIGMDNDCTGATVGSIVGACLGFDAIPAYWYERFNDTVRTYIKDNGSLSIEDVVARFVKLNG
ncbi:MAG: ADP-ribosylglycohydrolase family protein [Clostridia bacterium]|nr:ADP-ribosylglycohydrolase family protein [Clostridia bacterium]